MGKSVIRCLQAKSKNLDGIEVLGGMTLYDTFKGVMIGVFVTFCDL